MSWRKISTASTHPMYGSDRHVCLRAVSELGAAAVATASCSSFPNGLLRISPSQNLVYAIDTAVGTREYNARDLITPGESL